MDSLEIGVRIVAGAALILANGFFVAVEFALTRVRQYPESEFDTPALERAWEMTQDLEIYLTSCQVGITATSIGVGIVAEPALAAVFEPVFRASALAAVGAGSVLAFVIINLVHLTHGEQTPTYLGVERSKQVCEYGATPLYWFAKLISPVMRIGDSVAKWTLSLWGVEMTGAWLEAETEVIETRADLRHRMESVLKRGDLSDERLTEVVSALEIGRVPVRAVMIDTDEIVDLSTERSLEANRQRMADHPHVRYPLVGDSLEDFRGIVYLPEVFRDLDDLQSGEDTLEDVAHPPLSLSASLSVSDAIDRFQAERQELALVTGEDDSVLGLVTVTDALEAIAGQIEDPFDAEVDT